MAEVYKPWFDSLSHWLTTVDHKDVGSLYLLLGMWSGILGLVFRVIIRTELMHPGAFYGEAIYNVIITSHGFLIIFYIVMPLIIGFYGN